MSHKMPVLFVGHGSPMNAVEKNKYSTAWAEIAKTLPRPKAILCISAHWLSAGVRITHSEHPKTIHDFYGFPQKLFDVQYPALGNPALAEKIHNLPGRPKVHLDNSWGLDHGAWSVLVQMYPKADIPVMQLSIDMSEPPSFHFELGQKLKELREEGVLILGSGNVVHNLRMIAWDKPGQGFDWAEDFHSWVKSQLKTKNFSSLVRDFDKTRAGKLSVPTLDHYLPLLYVLGAVNDDDELEILVDECDLGSLSMLSFQFS